MQMSLVQGLMPATQPALIAEPPPGGQDNCAETRRGRVALNPELVDRACSGDAEAFSAMYNGFAAMVHGIVLSRVPYDDVPDVVQEVFLAAFRNIHTLRDRSAVGAWLAVIARNQATQFHRTHRTVEELNHAHKGRDRRTIEALEVMDTIRSLPEAYRETLVLRLVEGMTGAEIADRTGLTPESVRVNLHRGMEMLRQKLGISGGRK
jgi:RNA polymerase sigma-70 factor, ECF subfamily